MLFKKRTRFIRPHGLKRAARAVRDNRRARCHGLNRGNAGILLLRMDEPQGPGKQALLGALVEVAAKWMLRPAMASSRFRSSPSPTITSGMFKRLNARIAISTFLYGRKRETMAK